MKSLSPDRQKRITGFIIIIYAVGIIGTAVPLTRELFSHLNPLVLLLSFAIILFFHQNGFDTKTSVLFTSIFLVSWIIEAIGVKTGLLFGTYSYGRGLGFKILETPLIIGINWALLVYCTASVTDKLNTGPVVKVLTASLLMVIYDFFMEQVAPRMDMWTFEGGPAPFRNYLSWFLLALIFHSSLRLTAIKADNRFAPLIFICQSIFFIILFIFFKLTG